MASLAGIQSKVIVSRIDVVSDDGDGVLDITHNADNGKTTIVVRKAWESSWNSSGPTFVIDGGDVNALAAIIAGHDASPYSDHLGRPGSYNARYTKDDPGSADEKRASEIADARCSELDIERAKSARIAEERELLRLTLIHEHSSDLHSTGMVEGCETCDRTANFISNRYVSPEPIEDDADEPFNPFLAESQS